MENASQIQQIPPQIKQLSTVHQFQTQMGATGQSNVFVLKDIIGIKRVVLVRKLQQMV
jgi:hypothetical protein